MAGDEELVSTASRRIVEGTFDNLAPCGMMSGVDSGAR